VRPSISSPPLVLASSARLLPPLAPRRLGRGRLGILSELAGAPWAGRLALGRWMDEGRAFHAERLRQGQCGFPRRRALPALQPGEGVLHTLKRHGGRVEGVVILAIDVPRSWLRRSKQGLWYCPRDLAPERIRGVVTFAALARSPVEEAAA